MKAGPHCPAKRGSAGRYWPTGARIRRGHDGTGCPSSESYRATEDPPRQRECHCCAGRRSSGRDSEHRGHQQGAAPSPCCSGTALLLPGERAAGDDRALAGACELWHDQPHTRRPHPGRATAEIDHGASAAPVPRRRRATGAVGRSERRSARRPLCCGGSSTRCTCRVAPRRAEQAAPGTSAARPGPSAKAEACGRAEGDCDQLGGRLRRVHRELH